MGDQQINIEVCRVCLTKSDELLDIYSANIDEINIARSLSVIGSLRILKNDGKPSGICQNCYCQLKQAFGFREKCRLSDKRLQGKSISQSYLCSICGKLFSRFAYFTRHNRMHTGDRPYKCQICHRPFRQRCHLIEHERSHAGVKTYRCHLCPKSFVRYDVCRVHKRNHTKKPECDICGQMLLGRIDLARHKKMHGSSEFKCKECNISFHLNEDLEEHLENKHEINLNVQIENSTENMTSSWIESELNGTYSLSCDLNEMLKKCEHCHLEFSTDQHLAEHLQTHFEEKPFICMICEKPFKKESLLDNHVRNTHNTIDGIKIISCGICLKAFRSTGGLRRHQNIHANIKPYSCVFCEKKFTQSSHLRQHIRVHTGEKPHECSVCFKCFTSRSQLTVHMRTHSGDRPFNCSVCGKGCTTSTMLKIHVRTHTGEAPYKCQKCSKTFSRSDVLALHKKNKEH